MESLDLSTHQTSTFENQELTSRSSMPNRISRCGLGIVLPNYLQPTQIMNHQTIQTKKNQLMSYLTHYTTRGRKMNKVFLDLLSLLNENYTITHNQFAVILPFLRRELMFRNFNDEDIKEYFKDFIRAKTTDFSSKLEPEKMTSVSLETFM